MDDSVIIVGGGLSGLRAASLLHSQGIKCAVLEAQDRIGGRVLSVEVEDKPELGKFDLGPTWYWPRYESAMNRLVEELGLATFEQFNDGRVLLERSINELPEQHNLSSDAMEYSRRFIGGAQSLIDALAATLPPDAIHLNTRVISIHHQNNDRVMVQTNAGDFYGNSVIIALPPRVAEQNITFWPELPANVKTNLMNKPTWMANQAKVIAVYEKPFWRDHGLSGFASSWVGPLQEIHDASPSPDSGALFGFFSLPSEMRLNMGQEQLLELVVEQLTRLFGPFSKNTKAILYKDWSTDTNIAVNEDAAPLQYFPNYGPILDGDRVQHIYFAGTETAYGQGGHLEGALQSAERVASEVIKQLS